MKLSKYVTPSKQITIKQHIYPKSGLRRFAQAGQLDVLNLRTGLKKPLSTNAPIFWVNRAWDQRTENGKIVARIESEFGKVVSRIHSEVGCRLSVSDHAVISAMFSLWRIRQHRANHPLSDLYVGLPERQVSDAAVDDLEHRGVMSIAADGKIPGHQIAGPLLQFALNRQINSMQGTHWGLVRTRQGEGEFVLPDTFGDYMVMPVSPGCCLIANEFEGVLGADGISHLNSVAQECAKSFLAARVLSACPGLFEGPPKPVKGIDRTGLCATCSDGALSEH